jgi:hypothetical protein
VEFGGSGDKVTALESWAAENVMKVCLGGCRVGAEIARRISACSENGGAHRRSWEGADLTMSHLFFQMLGTLGGHLSTEKGDVGCSEAALYRVKSPVYLMLVEESPYWSSSDREKTRMSTE